MKLIITNTEWADEMDIWGFETVSDKFYDIGVRILSYYFKENPDQDLELWVGTNEQVYFSEDFSQGFKVKDVTSEQEAHLLTMFGYTCRGHALFSRLVDTALDTLHNVKDEMYDVFNKEFEEATRA